MKRDIARILALVGLLAILWTASRIDSSGTAWFVSAEASSQEVERSSSAPDEPVPAVDPRPTYGSAAIADIPFQRQEPDFSGEACVAMYLAKLGHKVSQHDVFNLSEVNPEWARGCRAVDLWRALYHLGFNTRAVEFPVVEENGRLQVEAQFQQLHADLVQGVPTIVLARIPVDVPRPAERNGERDGEQDGAVRSTDRDSQAGSREKETPDAGDDETPAEAPPKPSYVRRFWLVWGYDADTDSVLYHDPLLVAGAGQKLSRADFFQRWVIPKGQQGWHVVRVRMEPLDVRVPLPSDRFSNAHFAQHLIRRKKQIPEGFSIVIERPFVVLGDEAAEVVRDHASGTIRWTIDRLKRAYFESDPDQILEIWLFKDRDSYESHTEEIFGDRPGTPFGYYTRRHGALIMNISTGTGTLVHEIVHPFMEANFPDCPSWFNEGLASLYEQCGDRRGQIWGYTNWRLRGLQLSIQPPPSEENESDGAPDSQGDSSVGERQPAAADAGPEASEPPASRVPPFRQLCETTTREFYVEDPGTNYAQARYLCYYLQQTGKLQAFYEQFRANAKEDPTGYETLKKVLGVKNEQEMEAFQKKWESWVLQLRF